MSSKGLRSKSPGITEAAFSRSDARQWRKSTERDCNDSRDTWWIVTELQWQQRHLVNCDWPDFVSMELMPCETTTAEARPPEFTFCYINTIIIITITITITTTIIIIIIFVRNIELNTMINLIIPNRATRPGPHFNSVCIPPLLAGQCIQFVDYVKYLGECIKCVCVWSLLQVQFWKI